MSDLKSPTDGSLHVRVSRESTADIKALAEEMLAGRPGEGWWSSYQIRIVARAYLAAQATVDQLQIKNDHLDARLEEELFRLLDEQVRNAQAKEAPCQLDG